MKIHLSHSDSIYGWCVCGYSKRRVKWSVSIDEVTCEICNSGGRSSFRLKNMMLSKDQLNNQYQSEAFAAKRIKEISDYIFEIQACQRRSQERKLELTRSAAGMLQKWVLKLTGKPRETVIEE